MVPIIIIIIIILVVGAGGAAGYYVYQSGYLGNTQPTEQQKSQESSPAPINNQSQAAATPVPAIPLAYP